MGDIRAGSEWVEYKHSTYVRVTVLHGDMIGKVRLNAMRRIKGEIMFHHETIDLKTWRTKREKTLKEFVDTSFEAFNEALLNART